MQKFILIVAAGLFSVTRASVPKRREISSSVSLSASASPTATPSSVTTYSKPTPTHKNLIPSWSYKKSSIAAACIFTTVAVAALILLAILAGRRLRKSWEKHKLEKQNERSSYSALPLTEKNLDSSLNLGLENKSSRESFMFSSSHSSDQSVILERPTPSRPVAVTHVANSNASFDKMNLDSIRPGQKGRIFGSTGIPKLQLKRYLVPGEARSGSVQNAPAVLHHSPVRASPLSAVVSSDMDVPVNIHRSEAPDRNRWDSIDENRKSASTESIGSNQLALLPSIQKSTSPLFRLSLFGGTSSRL